MSVSFALVVLGLVAARVIEASCDPAQRFGVGRTDLVFAVDEIGLDPVVRHR